MGSEMCIRDRYTYHLPTSATATNLGTAGGSTGFQSPQADGTDLNSLPTEISGYLFAPGTFIRLDHGTLDLGLVRDSVLNRSNDLHLFAEQWTKVCKVGYESVKLPLAVCPNGAGVAISRQLRAQLWSRRMRTSRRRVVGRCPRSRLRFRASPRMFVPLPGLSLIHI